MRKITENWTKQTINMSNHEPDFCYLKVTTNTNCARDLKCLPSINKSCIHV